MGVIDNSVTLAGRLVTLRPVSREDYPTLFRWRSDIESVQMLNFRRNIITYEQFVSEFEHLLPSSTLLLVLDRKSGSAIGYAMSYNPEPSSGSLSVGIFIESEYRLKGHGGEAALLCVNAVFRWFPVRRIFTEIYDFADDVMRLAQAMGFEESGYLPDHYWHEDRFWGLHRMMLARERWEALRERFADILRIERQYRELTRVV
jgi:RimJ/RimL family protein N-acetyltransferase